MLGPVFLLCYRVLGWYCRVLPEERARYLRARAALYFACLTDGGLDDDFAQQVYALVREQPELLDRLAGEVNGAGFIAWRRRLVIGTLRQALNSGAPSLW